MKTTKYIILTVAGALLMSLGGCKTEGTMLYDGGDNVCFWTHSLTHSFYNATPEQMPTDVIKARLNIMGYTAPYERRVEGVVVEDRPDTPPEQKRTTAKPEQYKVLGGYIPAGSDAGWFEVEVENIEEIAESNLKLHLRLVENEHFGHGLKENDYIYLTWSRKPLKPQTWNGMQYFFCATYSTKVYELFMEVTGLKEFWYYTPGPDPVNNPADMKVNEAQGVAWGTEFGNRVRAYNKDHPDSPLLHDDGDLKGEPIISIH